MYGKWSVTFAIFCFTVTAWANAQEQVSPSISAEFDAENPLRNVPAGSDALRRLPADPDASNSPRVAGAPARAWMQGLRDELRGEDPFRAISAVVKLRDMGAAGAGALVDTLRNPDLDQTVSLSVLRALQDIGPSAVPALVRGLEDVNDQSWDQFCQILGRLGPGAAPATPTLLRVLNNPAVDSSHRMSAVTLLGTIGPDAREAIPMLLDIFERESDFELRSEALRAVSQIGRVPAENAERLLQFLLNEENDDRLRLAVSDVLARQEHVSPAILPSLIGMLDPVFGEDTCVAAAKVIGQLGPDAAAAIPALESLLGHESESMRMSAAAAIGRIGSVPESAAGELVRLAQAEENKDLRDVVGNALKNLGPAAINRLTAGLASTDKAIRDNTLATIAAIGPQAKAAERSIVQILVDPNQADSHLNCIHTLQAIRADAALVTAPLARILSNTTEDIELRSAAAAALDDLGSDARQIIPLLTGILRQPREEPAMRAVAALSLGRMSRTVVPDLFEALRDQSLEVRLAAAKALCMHDESREHGLAAAIRELAFPENVESAALVLEWAGPLAIPQLGVVLRSKDAELEHRLATANVLGRIGGSGAELLVQAMDDDNADISSTAEDLLRSMGHRDAVPPLLVAINHHERAAQREPGSERRRQLVQRMKQVIIDVNDLQGGPGLGGGMGAGAGSAPWQPSASPGASSSDSTGHVITGIGHGGSAKKSTVTVDVPRSEPAGGSGRPIGGTFKATGAEVKPAWKIVKVFYGTNRKPLNTVAERRYLELQSYYPVIAVGGLTMLLSTIGFLRSRSVGKAVLAGIGLVATLVLAYPATRQTVKFEQAAYGRPGPAYGTERNDTLELGSCDVSIPATHQFGELESPTIFEIKQDPNRHIVVQSVRQFEPERFHEALKSHLAAHGSSILVFVHGYNVNFDDAARRTAQMAEDLEFPGAPLFFSWPSQGNWYEYREDERQVEMAVTPLKQFLLDVSRRSGAKSIHLIAHSMGNRALTEALREIELEATDQQKMFNQVVLAAPDIDAGIFQTRIVPAIQAKSQRVTLYASSNDLALVASRTFNSGDRRAGDTSRGVIVVPGIETIDVSEVDTSLLGHSYYGDNPTVLTDLKDLLRHAKSAADRPSLESQKTKEDLNYWIFRAVNALSRTDSPATQR